MAACVSRPVRGQRKLSRYPFSLKEDLKIIIMKNTIKISRVFLKTKELVRDQLIRLDEVKTLSSLFSRFAFKIVSLCLRDNRKITNRIRLIHKFGMYLIQMNKRHGSTYVVKYLKACSLAISKVIAQQPFQSLKEIEPDLNLPRLSRSGLPVIIGTRDRRSIVQGSHKVIKLYLSIFNLYRIIKIPCKLNLSTITLPYTGDINYLRMLCSSIHRDMDRVLKGFVGKFDVASHRYLWLETSSTTHSKS